MVVAQPMAEMSDRPLSPLTDAGGSVVGAVLSHLMDASTAEMPPPPPLPRYTSTPSKFSQFLFLLLHYLPYRLPVIHRHIVVPLEKYLRLGHIQQMRNLIVMGENGLRKIIVLNKTSMVLIHSENGS